MLVVTQEHITSTSCNLGSTILEASDKLDDSEIKSFRRCVCCISLL